MTALREIELMGRSHGRDAELDAVVAELDAAQRAGRGRGLHNGVQSAVLAMLDALDAPEVAAPSRAALLALAHELTTETQRMMLAAALYELAEVTRRRAAVLPAVPRTRTA